MNPNLQILLDLTQQSEMLSSEEKNAFFNSLKAVEKELEITAFKLDRTEKIKRTTAILLEETIEELEQKRKAVEAQKRELEIESALERVRARTMGMQKSEELKDVIQVVYEQFVHLGVHTEHTGFVMDYKERNDYNIWIADQFGSPSQVTIPYFDCIYYNRFNEAKKNGTDFFATTLSFEEKNRFYQDLFMHVPGFPEESKKIIFNHPGFSISTVLLENVALYIENFTGIPYSNEEDAILLRFGKVFQQTYTRFLDLQKAEAQYREAQIEAALERVRSRTMAMQKSDELAETAAVVFKQLITLGIEPNRLYIAIIRDDSGDLEFWITDEDGSKVSSRFKGNVYRNESMLLMYDGWKQQKKSITIEMEGEVLRNYFHYLSNELKVPFKGGLSQKRRVQNLAYFSRGFIGIASPDNQPEETIQLLERFAGVFNLTFTRFNDLKIAEAHAEQAELDLVKLQKEKKRAEDALTELKAAQAQLIHAEKMASLGELTAGIAHEIQNPLNFVNNFSEVSIELVDELRKHLALVKTQYIASPPASQQIAITQLDDAQDILDDLARNQQKISHHGKRASGIVKGMLEHSRSSTGQKEPTDINVLADEYLRLAYHGLRAKDKSFNADFKTELDEKLPKINIVPQDFGRVLLNLFNNAFYAVNTKRQSLPSPYTPTVKVATRNNGNHVEIHVSDNGNGIPKNVLEKIFQPFFTTKPAGDGTGLGLSLSYDIIKAHGGEIKVDTKEGAGTEFIIVLPK